MKNILFFITVIALAGSSGFLLQQYLIEKEPVRKTMPNPVINKPAQEFAMADLNGNMRNITEWKGKVVLLNFWATWCPPCLKEIPDFIELQKEYSKADFQIIGIAIDKIDDVRSFAKEMKINYPIFPNEIESIGLSQRFGNTMGALPYSVFINKEGVVTNTIMGELSKIRAEEILKSLGVKP